MIIKKENIFIACANHRPIYTKISLCVLLALSLLFSISLSAKEKIYWAKYDLKPLFLLAGKNADTGMGDEMFNLIQQSLPQYEHHNYTSVMVRIIRDLQGNILTCSGLLQRNQLATKVLASLPVLQIPNHSLQFHKSRLTQIEQLIGQPFSEPLSLEALITAKPEIKISITEHRSYGKKINRIIKKYSANFIIHPAQLTIADHIKLTEKKRVTFTLEYPFVSVYTFKDGAQPEYYSTEILESQEHLFGHVLCTNTPVGRQVIADINKLIKTNWLTPPYQHIVERWLPQSSIQSYRLQYKKIREKYQ
jgi:uncharacterized protein (TIGR02285 family)